MLRIKPAYLKFHSWPADKAAGAVMSSSCSCLLVKYKTDDYRTGTEVTKLLKAYRPSA